MSNNKNNTRVLYLYSGSRKDKFSGKLGVDCPDTQFYGLNHLENFGVVAMYREWEDVVKSKFFTKVLGFRIKHLLMFLFTKGYDIVFGSSVLYLMVFKKIFKTQTKFILLNMGITRTIYANRKSTIKSWFIRTLLSELDGIVCLSITQKKYLNNIYPFLCSRVFVVPLGVDVQYYHPQYQQRANYILSAGRDNGRDYATVISVAEKLPDHEFHLVCDPRNIPKGVSIPSNVKILYNLPLHEWDKKFYEAKMLLLLTHSDDFEDGSDCSGQTALLQAMASGIPIIATNKEYLKEYAIDGEEVLSVNAYDVDDVIAKIKKIEGSPDFTQAMVVRARSKVERMFSTHSMAGALAKVFHSVMSVKI